MKKFYLLLSSLVFVLSLSAQDREIEENAPEIMEVISPDFDWENFDNKQARCKFKKNVLELECFKKNQHACTHTELDFDVSNSDFIICFQIDVEKLDDEHRVGIVYDFKNQKNFHALCFGKKQYSLLCYENGDNVVVKEGLYKLDNKKRLLITLKKKGKRVEFYLGSKYFPLTTLKNCEITNQSVGFYVENETKINITGLGYRVLLKKDVEEE